MGGGAWGEMSKVLGHLPKGVNTPDEAAHAFL
jgi:hypothetical protein